MDHWMSHLFPAEVGTIDDFARFSKRLRAAMGPHIPLDMRFAEITLSNGSKTYDVLTSPAA
jgi:hypothetical protein